MEPSDVRVWFAPLGPIGFRIQAGDASALDACRELNVLLSPHKLATSCEILKVRHSQALTVLTHLATRSEEAVSILPASYGPRERQPPFNVKPSLLLGHSTQDGGNHLDLSASRP